ncbi:MAG: transposase [Cyclobacteriaceae bacterium]
MLDYFEVTSAEKTDEGYWISLKERDLLPTEFLGHKLNSHGFYGEVTVKDFPIRGKACFLKIKRRRWLNESLDKVISRDWELIATGTRMTKEFASFLKAVHRHNASKL